VPELAGIHHAKIPVSDLDRSLPWYEQVFGATRLAHLDHRTPDGTLYAHILDVPGLPFPLELRLAPMQAAGITTFDPLDFAIETRDDLRAWTGHLESLGIEHSGELRGLVGWLLAFNDPDGLSIRIYTNESHAPDGETNDASSPWLQYADVSRL
jgi:catechol 2,3-dioxygenase-like lactoylglutathione lyase family enzyme